jgi:DNA-binding NarL/FixJ family response regulator
MRYNLIVRREAAVSDRAGRTAVLLDPYPLWLDAIEPVLASAGFTVVGKATSPENAAALVGEHRPDLLVAEPATHAGESRTLAVLREIVQREAPLKLVVLARSKEPQDIVAAFAVGASAYVVKTAHPADIATAIRQAFDHSIVFQRRVGDRDPARRPPARRGSDATLTRRELEILGLVAEGHSNGVLARMLWVTEQTVKFHLSNIYRKLGVSNRTEASRWAHEHELVPLGEPALAT